MVPASLALALFAAAPSYAQIEARFAETPKAVTIAELEALVAERPHDPIAAKAALWAADLAMQAVDLPRAKRDYELAAAYGGEWQPKAELGLAGVARATREYKTALAYYDALAKLPDPYVSFASREAARQTRNERFRFDLSIVFAVLIAALSLSRLAAAFARRGLAAVWPLPQEVLFFLSLGGIAFVASVKLDAQARGAVWTILGGGLLLVLSQAAAERAATGASRRARLARAVVGVAGGAALLYCAVFLFGLTDALLETLRIGAAM